MDGKEEKGTGRKYGTQEEVRNLQTLHAYDASSEVCLFSKPIDSKTNGIPVAQELLKSMNLKGCIVTFDALHTQKDTVSIICDAGGDYVGGLKGNQSGLLADAELVFSSECIENLKKSELHYLKQVEKSHGQLETRQYYMTEAAFGSSRKSDWEKLKTFILLVKTTVDLTTQKNVRRPDTTFPVFQTLIFAPRQYAGTGLWKTNCTGILTTAFQKTIIQPWIRRPSQT